MEDKAQSMDELLKAAGEEGIEIPDELLESVAGGLNTNETVRLFQAMARSKRSGKTMNVFLAELKDGVSVLGKLDDKDYNEAVAFVKHYWK